MQITKRVLFLVPAVAVFVASPAGASLDTSPAHGIATTARHTVNVDVLDITKDDQSRLAQFVINAAEGVPSRIGTTSGAEVYTVRVVVDAERIQFDIDRIERGSAASQVHFTTSVPLVVGRKIVIGKLQRADGSSTEVTVTAH